MAFEFINKLPTPAEIKEQFPLPASCIATKAQRDEEVKNIIAGKSDKFLVIIGPCSADNEESVLRLYRPPCESSGSRSRTN